MQLIEFYLTASKNDDITNGVTTLDIVLIQRHILGLKPLNSPYKILAADVNNSKVLQHETFQILEGLFLELPLNFQMQHRYGNLFLLTTSLQIPKIPGMLLRI